MAEQKTKPSDPMFFEVLSSSVTVDVEVGMTDDGYKVYLERPSDGSGVAIDIDEDTYKALERNFILREVDER